MCWVLGVRVTMVATQCYRELPEAVNLQREMVYSAHGSEGPGLGLRSLVKVSDNAGSEVVSEQKIHITSQSAGRERLVPTVPHSNTSV